MGLFDLWCRPTVTGPSGAVHQTLAAEFVAAGAPVPEWPDAVRRSNLNLAGGTIRTRGEEIRVRTLGRKYTGEELASIVVLARPEGEIITIGGRPASTWWRSPTGERSSSPSAKMQTLRLWFAWSEDRPVKITP
mgnify:CR=1 FL=1